MVCVSVLASSLQPGRLFFFFFFWHNGGFRWVQGLKNLGQHPRCSTFLQVFPRIVSGHISWSVFHIQLVWTIPFLFLGDALHDAAQILSASDGICPGS